jgi:hypothetical protein
LLYANSKFSEIEIKKAIPFTIATKIPRINLVRGIKYLHNKKL